MKSPVQGSVRGRMLIGITAALLALLPLHATLAGAPESRVKLTREYDLKAAFLFNFAQFVEWPRGAFADATTPITIGILGEDPFGGSLDEIVSNEAIRGRKLVVRRYRDAREIGDCHILFIGASSPIDEQLRAHLESKPILTVGETESFSAASGIIRFMMVENRVRLRINVDAARAARLVISSKLLRQAEIVAAASKQ